MHPLLEAHLENLRVDEVNLLPPDEGRLNSPLVQEYKEEIRKIEAGTPSGEDNLLLQGGDPVLVQTLIQGLRSQSSLIQANTAIPQE